MGVRTAVEDRDVMCEVRSGIFRRHNDKGRHKCMEERKKRRVKEQQSASQCSNCSNGSEVK